MCLFNMSSKELIDRVSKYPYTTGNVGSSGCWYYTQLDKSYVTDPTDRSFFDQNQTTEVSSRVLPDKWTFDGTPGISLSPHPQYDPAFIKYDHIQINPVIQGDSIAFSGDPSKIKFQPVSPINNLGISLPVNTGVTLMRNPFDYTNVPPSNFSGLRNEQLH